MQSVHLPAWAERAESRRCRSPGRTGQDPANSQPETEVEAALANETGCELGRNVPRRWRRDLFRAVDPVKMALQKHGLRHLG